MAPISPGKMSGPPRKPKKPTATTKAHRFEGFTKRIAKIKIDPVHTVQKTRVAEDHGDLSTSFFRSALDEWSELNLSATFTSFFNKAQPLTESLPQLLHHSDVIFVLLHEHIAKQDVLALEPLLSLVAHLAHDLGQAFEQHFSSVVKLVAQVSASVEDPAAIEHCFTCLAWMFKYLSRLLVQDLRPLFEIMVPFFSSKKEYVRRFSGESLAFLLRKAAVMYAKKARPLEISISYLFDQLKDEEESGLESFRVALMTLLSESAVGVDAQLHSSVVDLFSCIFDTVGRMDHSNQHALTVVDGTIVTLIHRTDATGFRPLLQLVTDTVVNSQGNSSYHDQLSVKLLQAITATRKGSRIAEWKGTLEALLAQLQPHQNGSDEQEAFPNALLTVSATTMQYCPMDQLLPFTNKIVESIVGGASAAQFFTFCEMVADLGKQRFQDLLLPRLQQYIVTSWKSNEDGVCYLLRQLRKGYFVSPKSGESGYIACPADWEQHVVEHLLQLSPEAGFPGNTAKYFQLHKYLHFPRQSSTRESLRSLLELFLNSALSRQHVVFDAPLRLNVGWAFSLYILLAKSKPITDWNNLASSILQCRPEYYQLLPFLESCLEVLSFAQLDTSWECEYEPIETALCDNMLSESLELRETSLEILLALGKARKDTWLEETCNLLLEIIKIRYLPSNARQISMLIRRLPRQQQLNDHTTTLHRLVPLFTLGLLRHYHDRNRKDLCASLSLMASNGKAEDIIIDVATQWLQKPGSLEPLGGSAKKGVIHNRLAFYECSNYQAVHKLSTDTLERHLNASNELHQEFEQSHALRPATTPTESRTLSLQLFLEIPEIAEKRSRVLSPVFLSVQQGMANHHVPQSDESASSHTVSPDFNDQPWSLYERKLFLELMGKFINPRVLYRSRELHDHLMELLTNGNSDIRRLAFLALLNWKDPSLPRYREILLRVAEEKNATTELALLLANDEQTGSIEPHDRDHVLPVLLRLVFGQLVGRTGTHGSQEAKRKSILRLLFRMEEREINVFLGITLGRLGEISFADQANSPDNVLDRDILSKDQQYGFLRMMASIQETLESQYAFHGKKVLDAVLYCTARAYRQTKHMLDSDTETAHMPALVKNIRRSGTQCLTTIFESCPDLDWTAYLPVIFDEIVNPRVPNLAVEMAQGISGMLRLFSVWSKSSRLVRLLKRNAMLSENLWKLLSTSSARDDVRLYVLQHILIPLLEISAELDLDHNAASEILASDIDLLLQSFVGLLERQPPKDLLLAATKAIPLLAPYAVSSTSANDVLDLLITLICEPAQRIPPHVKGQLLAATESLLKSRQDHVASTTKLKLYGVVAELFNYFKDQPNRVLLGELLLALTKNDETMQVTVQICQDLNAVSNQNLGEIDYERRLAAYNTVNTLSLSETSPRQWLPILQNLLFFARISDDFAIRSNATACLKRYVVEACLSLESEHLTSVSSVLLPAFKKGVKEKSELVRADFVAMYGMVVKHLPNAPDLEDMKVLLVGDDEEASFFTNILHIQQHRRLRAIRRLLGEVERGAIKPLNIAGFFLPLLEKFIDDEGDDETAQGVKGQSIAATSILLQWIDWKSFRTLFRQYKTDLDLAARPEKEAIKLLSNAADALTAVCIGGQGSTSVSEPKPYLQITLPSQDVVSTELKNNFIPKLSKFIHHKDEAEISLRIPAAKVAVRLIKLLPPEEVSFLVAPIILDISQILRSRTQESRDIARNTLSEIILLLGPSSVQFVVKEMRTTLTRGYQLHVLSYVLHTILLQTAEDRKPGDLDYCLEDLVSVIMDDIFGAVGLEKENQDYISSMKEVKSNKSQDSMELLAKSASVKSMPKLIHPLQSVLTGNMTTRQVRQVDELLRRIGVGISHNPAASSRDLLIFAYELIKAFYQQKTKGSERIMTNDERNRQRYLVQLKGANESTRSTSSSSQYKIARFALDLVRSTLAKNPILLTAENVHGFLPVIGDALLEAQDDVRMSAFRLLSTIIRLPLPDLDKNAPLYVMEAVKVIRSSTSTNDESSQAAMKLVAAVLRERREVEVRDSDIAYLLHRTMPDIEEPDRQGVTFNFIKAVMARRYELPEVYELMDKVAFMMVTNQTRSARDVARGVYVHFLLDYAQSKTRWSKQIRFLIKNLTYEHKEGRQAVMEATHTLLQKLQGEPLHETISIFFIPVVLAMVNDDDPGCREMAGALLAQIFRVADASQLDALLQNLRSWSAQTDNKILLKVSLLAWSVYFDVVTTGAETEIPSIRKSLARALKDEEDSDLDWETKYQALELFSKLSSTYPAMTMTQDQSSIWSIVRRMLSSQHEWIQISAAHIISVFFQDCNDAGVGSKPRLEGKHGLRFDRSATTDLLRGSVRVLKRNEGNMDLAQQTLENLAFLGKYVETTKLTCDIKARSSTDGTAVANGTTQSDASESEDLSDSEETTTKSIPAIEYLYHQLTLILRREPNKLSTASFTPRISALNLLSSLVAQTPLETLPTSILTSILVPLTHITDPSLQQPRSADQTFPATYQSYIESAQNLLEAIQRKVGDSAYIKLMTDVSKIVRERRGERKTKRAIDRVADPERAEREKKRKKDMKARRKKSVVDIHRQRRRGDLGF